MYTLDNLKINKKAIIKKIDCQKLVKTRLLDMGFIEGTEIQSMLDSPSKNIRAYLIKNTLIALRNNDSKRIMIEVFND